MIWAVSVYWKTILSNQEDLEVPANVTNSERRVKQEVLKLITGRTTLALLLFLDNYYSKNLFQLILSYTFVY